MSAPPSELGRRLRSAQERLRGVEVRPDACGFGIGPPRGGRLRRAFFRVDEVQRQALALVLDPRRLVGRDEAARHGDVLAGEEALVELATRRPSKEIDVVAWRRGVGCAR